MHLCVGTASVWVLDFKCEELVSDQRLQAAPEQGSLHMQLKAQGPVVMGSQKPYQDLS